MIVKAGETRGSRTALFALHMEEVIVLPGIFASRSANNFFLGILPSCELKSHMWLCYHTLNTQQQ